MSVQSNILQVLTTSGGQKGNLQYPINECEEEAIVAQVVIHKVPLSGNSSSASCMLSNMSQAFQMGKCEELSKVLGT